MTNIKEGVYANMIQQNNKQATAYNAQKTEYIKIPSKTIKNNNGKLSEFLKSHQINKESDEQPTNTRIGEKNMNIFGGSYNISDEEYKTFLELHYEEVFIKKNPEYLTEKQLDKEGPILIDIDLRFELNIAGRVYTTDHIDDLLESYLGILKNIYQFDDTSKFPIYVYEKANVNRVTEKNITKDGIHIIIGIQADRITQQIIRKQMIKILEEIWGDFPITNTWEDVLDSGISTGKVNWQLHGSRKPGFEPYELTRIFEVSFDTKDEEFMRKKIPIEKFNIKENLMKLSARCKTHPSFFYKNEFISVREQALSSGDVNGTGDTKKRKIVRQEIDQNNLSIFQVTNRDELKEVVNQFLDSIVKCSLDYELIEAHDYTMTLPESYYGPGSYLKWIRVGWALRNISDRLFVVWVAFSAQSKDFDFRDIPELYEKWIRFDLNNPNGLTKRSIMHWSKMDAREKYKEVRENSIDYYIDQTLGEGTEDKKMKGCGDFDLAVVLYHLYKDEFVCVSVKGNIWYTYRKHRWEEIDSGTTLRKAISMELRDMYRKKATKLIQLSSNDDSDTAKGVLNMKSEKILDICLRLARTSDKKNIMTEAKELFYDGTFLQKLDTNPYLLCFNNGVIDFKEKVFRRGYPEDNISKTTNIDYRPVDRVRDKVVIEEISDFMHKLFPVKELHDYMWEHLASTLIGTSSNQTFNMYIGVGQNGKSVLMSLMEMVLGEYKGDVPLPLITDKRTKIGGLAPEIVALKGIRYAVINEPSKGDRINEGIMKQLTSGIDPIQARAPYMPQAITFIPQFKLVVCSNEFMEVKSQDHGTWRRIRVVDFMSMFVENPTIGDKNKPYQYLLDKNIKEKFAYWKEVFAALLVEKAFETNGNVKDCSIVLKSSNAYRESQDYIAEFISDKIIVDPKGTITKTELTSEFAIWYQGAYGKGGPSPKDVQAYMDKRFGKFSEHKCWKGARINYDRDNIVDMGQDNIQDIDEYDIDENEL